MYTKKEIADSIVKFITNDLMADIDDKHLKFTLCMAKKSLHENPALIDAFFESPLVSSVVKSDGEEYDIDSLARTMKNVLSGYDSYSIMIPGIPMFAPKDNIVKISASDVDKILAYLPQTEINAQNGVAVQ